MPRVLPPADQNDLLLVIGDQQFTIRRYMNLVAELELEITQLRQPLDGKDGEKERANAAHPHAVV